MTDHLLPFPSELNAQTEVESPVESPEPTVVRMSAWKSTLIALASLVGFLGVVLGVMALGGAVIHALVPSHQFDVFYALHKEFVVIALLVVSVIWLIPPHPWSEKVVQPADQDQATGDGNALALSDAACRAASPLPSSPRGVPMT